MAPRKSKPSSRPAVPREDPQGPLEAEAGGLLTIDLEAIAGNWRTLSGVVLPTECAAVVKADAYGCGIDVVVPALSKAGCKTFFVADLAEGRRARAADPGATVYVLNGLIPETAQSFAQHNLRPVINGLTEFAEWDAFVASTNWTGGAALHVDTGMNRLGVTPQDAAALAPRLRSENHGITLIMSHFACADTPAHPLNDRQIKLFREVRQLFRGVPASLANSSGIYLGNPAHADIVRPGSALYGVNPTPSLENPMRPVVRLEARILQVRHVKPRESVGYAAGWVAQRDTRAAILAVGYADGYARAMGEPPAKPAAHVMIGGERCPLIGRVSMDLIAIDVTDLPDGVARRGARATLIGDGIDVDLAGMWRGSIGYEVLTSLGRRFHRSWT